MTPNKERALVLADLEAELRAFEGGQTGRRRVVVCHPSVVHHLRMVVSAFPDAHLITVVGSDFTPLRHLHIRGEGAVREEVA